MIDPTAAEILKLNSGIYTWYVSFASPRHSQGGRATTYNAAAAAVARAVEAMRVDPDATVRESLR